MINQNQIKGEIGETLLDDIKHLVDNSMKLLTLSDTIVYDNISTLTSVFDMSEIINSESSTIMNGTVEVKNVSLTEFIDFEVIENGLSLYNGKINPDSILSFSSERNNLIIKVNENCIVNYNIKYI